MIPVIGLTLTMGYLSLWIVGLSKALDPFVVGIILGMVVRALIGNISLFKKGLDIIPKIFIHIGIIV